MEYTETIKTINIFIMLIINLFILTIHYMFIIYSRKNIYLSNRCPLLLLFVTLTIAILCDFHLLKASFGNKIHHLVYFNLQNIFTIICISIYTYRGVFIYLNNNKKTLCNFRYIFLFMNLLFIFYVIFINVCYYNIYFDSDYWQYYPLWVIYSFYLFIFHPLIIYLLNKKIDSDIKLDFIYSMFILFSGFILELINIIYNKNMRFSNYEIIKNYIQCATICLTCLSYSFIPLLKYHFNKAINIEKNINTNEIISKILQDDEIAKDNNDKDDTYINIYKKYIYRTYNDLNKM